MQVTTTRHDDALVYHLKGRLAIAGTAELEQDIGQAIAGGAQRLIFDLTELEYISSAGLRVLVVTLKQLPPGAPPVGLVGVRPVIQQILEISGLTTSFQLVPTLADALASKK